ncbi:hypothetical protein B566_EDAN002565 [Ephemera danica]|nr:hypothetical protein B566_EDAN002565 [Ephemera danica]
MTAFEEMGVLPEIAQAVEEMEWTLPTDVQAEAIPLILGGGDVLMAAETGSGKTGAFCLPIVQIVWETLKDIAEGKYKKSSCISTEWLLSFSDRDKSLVITPDGLRCQSREQREWHGGRGTKGVGFKGRYYYEATVTDEGLCRVGWATPMASRDLGTCKFGFGFGGTGKKSNCRQFDDYGEAYGKNDVLGCFLDLESKKISFSKNGVDLGVAFNIPGNMSDASFFPAVVLKNAEMSFNFGKQPFKHPPKSGFIGLSSAEKECVRTSSQESEQKDDAHVTNSPQAIIIEPSRELAEQTYNQLQKFMKHLKHPTIRILLVIGGANVKEQCNALNAGIDIVVATPGRVEDLISGGYLSLTNCRFFVLDEADGLLKQGYTQQIERMHGQIPKLTSDGRRLQMVVCSATLHAFEVKKMAEKLMHFPTWVDLKGEDAVPETVHHVVVMVDPQKDLSWHSLKSHVQTDGVHQHDRKGPGNNNAESLSEAVKMLKGEYCVKAIREHKMDRAIIFCRTKLDCDNLENYLIKMGGAEFSCVCLHGDRKPQERKANLETFKAKQVKFLICTDVAARGLDITGLPFMINITLPDEKSNYVHRIGRVGRAERMGLAISLVASVPEKVWYHGEWCPSRGKRCHNTQDIEDGGCCIWYNEMQARTGYKDHVAQMAPTVQELAALESKVQMSFLKRHFGQAR